MRRLSILALLSACSTSPIAPTSPIDDYGRAWCAHLVSCGLLGDGDRAACEQRNREEPPPSLTVDPGELAAGRIAYDTDTLRSCLDAVSQLGCGSYFLPSPCDRVVVGRAARGALCSSTFECPAGDTCFMPSSCAGTCAEAPALGQPCLADCAPHLRCPTVQEPGSGICQARPTAGQPCTAGSFNQCDDGLECIAAADFASGACQPPGALGARCMIYISQLDLQIGVAFPQGACAAGLICDFAQPLPVCAMPKALGEACAAWGDCAGGVCTALAPGLKNDHGIVSPFALGGSCVAPTARGAACSGQTCQFLDSCTSGVCARLPQLGDACAGGSGVPDTCVVGYCDSSSHCVARVPLDGACDPEVDSCVRPLSCDQGTRTCSYPPGCVSST